jgi:hypothetical protein
MEPTFSQTMATSRGKLEYGCRTHVTRMKGVKMTDLAKVQLLEAENRKLQSELEITRELVKKVEEQRDSIYWEYESIRYSLNEQFTSRTLATAE